MPTLKQRILELETALRFCSISVADGVQAPGPLPQAPGDWIALARWWLAQDRRCVTCGASGYTYTQKGVDEQWLCDWDVEGFPLLPGECPSWHARGTSLQWEKPSVGTAGKQRSPR